MKIGALQKFSGIDFPGRMSCIVFTQGCNFRCSYCHNPELVLPERFGEPLNEEIFLEFLERRKGAIEGVVITGGEPTIHRDLPKFIEKIKNEGFFVKLDTNGTNPKMIDELIGKNLLDYIAMDIKGSFNKYQLITNVEVEIRDIIKSMEIIMKSGIAYEFRTTVLKKFHAPEDFLEIGRYVKGAKKYVLQNFKPTKCIDKTLPEKGRPFDRFEMEKAKKILKDFVALVEVRM